MRLEKKLNLVHVQYYVIHNPSKTMLKKHPKKFTYSMRDVDAGKQYTGNVDTIPIDIIYKRMVGFIFSYKDFSNELKPLFSYSHKPERTPEDRIPRITNLQPYFKPGDNIVLSISLGIDNAPISFLWDNLTMTTTVKNILAMTPEKIQKAIRDEVVYQQIEGAKVKDTEDWVKCVLHQCPITSSMTAASYPKKIEDSMFKPQYIVQHTPFLDMTLTYDIHAESVSEEFQVAHKLDQAMIEPSLELTFFKDYNNLYEKIKKAVPNPKKLTKDDITITFKQYCELKDVDFVITDCM